MEKRGVATLPLHRGSAPSWLFDRMVELSDAIAAVVVEEYGPDELLDRLADPHWFQAFGCVLGFDWHSSGVTTTTTGALKEALDPDRHGLAVAGGKGATSRRTPEELATVPLDLSASDREALQYASRTSATVDGALVQDGHALYHHATVASESGRWAVVQQGMDTGGDASTARRYHWLSEDVEEFVVEPQSAICAEDRRSSVLDLSAASSAEARAVSVDLVNDGPEHLRRYFRAPGQRGLGEFAGADGGGRPDLPHLEMPAGHELREADLTERTVEQLENAYERQPADYEELVGVEGVGPKSLRALALVAELVHDADTAREDPAKYAYAHGGKDGTPHPVDRERYDRSIEYLRDALGEADVDRETRQTALDRLATLADGE